jgi:hypothetical protein
MTREKPNDDARKNPMMMRENPNDVARHLYDDDGQRP